MLLVCSQGFCGCSEGVDLSIGVVKRPCVPGTPRPLTPAARSSSLLLFKCAARAFEYACRWTLPALKAHPVRHPPPRPSDDALASERFFCASHSHRSTVGI